jgi:predicted transcriptional regulator
VLDRPAAVASRAAGRRASLVHLTPEEEMKAVTTFLRHHREGATVLDIAHGTKLGATVVVPALDVLMANGVVQRRAGSSGAAGSMSRFLLTSAGRRIG